MRKKKWKWKIIITQIKLKIKLFYDCPVKDMKIGNTKNRNDALFYVFRTYKQRDKIQRQIDRSGQYQNSWRITKKIFFKTR